MKLTLPPRWSLGMAAALVFLVAGCGTGHTAASPVDYKKSPGVIPTSTPMASKRAIKQAVKTECAAVRSVRHPARKLSGKPVAGHLAQFAALSPAWAEQLATAAKPDGTMRFPDGSKASTLSTRLGRMAVDLDLGNLDYRTKQKAKLSEATKEYTAFVRDLKKTTC